MNSEALREEIDSGHSVFFSPIFLPYSTSNHVLFLECASFLHVPAKPLFHVYVKSTL